MTQVRTATVIPFPGRATRKADVDHIDGHLDHLREMHSLCARRCVEPTIPAGPLSLYFGLQLRELKTEAALTWIEQRYPSARDAVEALRVSLSHLSEAAQGPVKNYPKDIITELKDCLASIEMIFDS